jgi:DNA-binding NtrC family response regulator
MPSPAHDRPVVLVVEDGEGTRQLSCLVLESYGFSCRSADSVEAAIGVLQEVHVDLLFSDIHFPGGQSGVDLANYVGERGLALPVLLTSGLAVEYVEEILPDGTAFLEKPYTPEQLLQAIRSMLNRRPSPTAPVAA